ncbi:hypothetical protein [Sutcliffiella rhizosphaerae]|uniref:Uncharacterized protein n=1 Tax=Sutcliffiella rhizosphaerae TaxID=2880967 RepID=A0ABN8AF30_9BACI|nr:hypothetical protein [Sutcliffiella rhizosphaerae]CAG9622946.1 hypothetical protein BACCIP111883_03741 [Sutcliffiella rhizosphaerae]
MKKSFFIVSFLVLLAFILSFYNSINNGNPTARDVIKKYPEADIIQMNGVVYSKVTHLDSTSYQIGSKIGEIKKQTNNSILYRDMYASKLRVGTAIFQAEGETVDQDFIPLLIFAELEGTFSVYQALIEG